MLKGEGTGGREGATAEKESGILCSGAVSQFQGDLFRSHGEETCRAKSRGNT